MSPLTLYYIQSNCRICGECWEWNSSAKSESAKRHPQVRRDGKQILIRREAYALARGPIPQDMLVVNDCGNPYCIRPGHQVAMTVSQKCQRSADRGLLGGPIRAAKVARWRRANSRVMDDEKVQRIRASTDTFDVIAKTEGVSRTHACRIKRGLSWADLTNPFSGLMR